MGNHVDGVSAALFEFGVALTAGPAAATPIATIAMAERQRLCDNLLAFSLILLPSLRFEVRVRFLNGSLVARRSISG